jgi:hypothetical protein
MKFCKLLPALALSLAAVTAATTVRANVYATDIKLNSSLTNTTGAPATAVTISYILNQPATAGVTVNILQGNTMVASMAGGTNMGTNSVSWTPSANGTFGVSVTAAAAGFTNWTKISLDSTNGNVAVYPEGIAVDNNTSSPFYGRVFVGCASDGGEHGVAQKCGIYKMNADGSPADEGSFGYGGYTTNDAGGTATGEMNSGGGFNPWRLRMGDDDRLYMDDYSDLGAIIAFDAKVSTNQVVINENGYRSNPDFGDLNFGINNFDVTATTTSHAAVWLCDLDSIDNDNFPNWGIWMYHLKNGAADPADTEGTQAVIAGTNSDLTQGSSGGCMVDVNQDIFVSQDTPDNIPDARSMEYPNWNGGALPPEAGGTNYAYGGTNNQVTWRAGTNDPTFETVQDTVLNNRQNPTLIALPMEAGNDSNPGIRVLNAANGSVVSVTNGATVQTLTNFDTPNEYSCVAWDNVGNLYGASPSLNYWRAWSPPGANQATTVAVATIQVGSATPASITSISVSGTTVTIYFTAGSSEPASAFTLLSSTTVNGAYTANAGANITGSGGSYQATTTVSGTTQFYKIEQAN